jgi:hypothetical protein
VTAPLDTPIRLELVRRGATWRVKVGGQETASAASEGAAGAGNVTVQFNDRHLRVTALRVRRI